jgi:hypothetical protein
MFSNLVGGPFGLALSTQIARTGRPRNEGSLAPSRRCAHRVCSADRFLRGATGLLLTRENHGLRRYSRFGLRRRRRPRKRSFTQRLVEDSARLRGLEFVGINPGPEQHLASNLSTMEAMQLLDRITLNPNQMNGHPCIRGMRLTVRRVVAAVAIYPNRDDPFPEVSRVGTGRRKTGAGIRRRRS